MSPSDGVKIDFSYYLPNIEGHFSTCTCIFYRPFFVKQSFIDFYTLIVLAKKTTSQLNKHEIGLVTFER